MQYRVFFGFAGLACLLFFPGSMDEQGFDPEMLPGEQTETGRMLEDRILAQSLIEYGQRVSSPESILVGVQILHRNPVVDPAKNVAGKEAAAENQHLKGLVEAAAQMREDDKVLLDFAARVNGELEEKSRRVSGGPKRWTVTIKRGEYYLLDPRLVYNVQEEALVSARAVTSEASPESATASHKDVTVGISVARDGSGKNLYTRAVSRGKTQVRWNSGPYKSGWYVKVHHLAGPDEGEFIIEAN